MRRLSKTTREIIITEIIHKLRQSFLEHKNKKAVERRFMKLHNIIFTNLVMTNYFYNNIDFMLDYLSQFTKWTPSRP